MSHEGTTVAKFNRVNRIPHNLYLLFFFLYLYAYAFERKKDPLNDERGELTLNRRAYDDKNGGHSVINEKQFQATTWKSGGERTLRGPHRILGKREPAIRSEVTGAGRRECLFFFLSVFSAPRSDKLPVIGAPRPYCPIELLRSTFLGFRKLEPDCSVTSGKRLRTPSCT